MAKLRGVQTAGLRDILLTAILFITVTSAQLNASQILTELPKCALNCVLAGISSSNCTLTDLTCTCADQALQSKLSICVQGACTFVEQQKVSAINIDLCAGGAVQNRQKEVEIPGIVFVAITVPIVILRCYSRYKIAGKLWWDDWAIGVATALLIGIVTIDIINVSKGFGKHLWDVDPRESTALLKLFVVGEVFYIATLTATKISILLFYFRVFRRRWFRHAIWSTIFMVAAWGIAFSLVIIFQCHPISGSWDRTIPSKCLSVNAIAFSSAAISIAQDVLILLLPITQLVGLQMNLQKKLNVLAMFGIGAVATVTSIIRLKFIVSFGDSKDPTWDNALPSIWSIVEVNVAMICACLPGIRAILSQWLPSLFDITHKSAVTGVSTQKDLTKWNNDRILSQRGNYDISIGFDHNGGGEVEDGFEMDDKNRDVKRMEDTKSMRVSGDTPSVYVEEVDVPTPLAGQRSPDTIHFDGRGSEEDLFVTDVRRRLKEEQLRRGDVARQIKRGGD